LIMSQQPAGHVPIGQKIKNVIHGEPANSPAAAAGYQQQQGYGGQGGVTHQPGTVGTGDFTSGGTGGGFTQSPGAVRNTTTSNPIGGLGSQQQGYAGSGPNTPSSTTSSQSGQGGQGLGGKLRAGAQEIKEGIMPGHHEEHHKSEHHDSNQSDDVYHTAPATGQQV
jgi:hypothetical protein